MTFLRWPASAIVGWKWVIEPWVGIVGKVGVVSDIGSSPVDLSRLRSLGLSRIWIAHFE